MFIKTCKEQWPIAIQMFIKQNAPADRRKYPSISILLLVVIKLQTTPFFKIEFQFFKKWYLKILIKLLLS